MTIEGIKSLIGQPESETLEYKSVLPPSKTIAQLLASFANTNGGIVILGVSDEGGVIVVNGLSKDFHANAIVQKALDLLSPKPAVHHFYIPVNDKSVYAIVIEKSEVPIYLEDKLFIRENLKTKQSNPSITLFSAGGYAKISMLSSHLEAFKSGATDSKVKLVEHYQSILKIADDFGAILYPSNPQTPTTNQEGKILLRILFSSFVDNFETYLSDLLYEIFLANPNTLKSSQQVTIEEVLNCSDILDFVKYWAKQKLGKLQKGSVKGFIKENAPIKSLEVIDKTVQNEIEKILQIRHLYAHRNGIVDEKFLQYFLGSFTLNAEHQMSMEQILEKMGYLADIVDKLDKSAIQKYRLATV